MTPNNLKKMMIFSNEEVKNLCEKFIEEESQERNVSKSYVVEEYIITGIIRNFPEKSDRLRDIYRLRHERYTDKNILESQ